MNKLNFPSFFGQYNNLLTVSDYFLHENFALYSVHREHTK